MRARSLDEPLVFPYNVDMKYRAKKSKKKTKIAICGASGYTGTEILRICGNHPHVEITAVTSEKSAGKKVTDLFPFLSHCKNLVYESLRKEKLLDKADVFFLALPHGASQETVDFFFVKKKIVIDLSADYRIMNPETYKEWYGLPHTHTSTLKEAAYGLPEMYRNKIKRASLIANPGCYPTGAILGLYPAIKDNVIDSTSIVIDAKSGTSGAGRKADVALSYCEINEGFKAYGIGTHRHTPEIEQELSAMAGKHITVDFTPHLLPVDRGILTTIYAPLKKKMTEKAIFDLYYRAYKNEPFIRMLEEGAYPNILNVRGTNNCHVGLKLNPRTDTLIIVTAIDNLGKGASGQAIQNMNIMLGLSETDGLGSCALYP